MNIVKYKDFNLNFLAHPHTGDLSIVTEENSVKQSIKNLVLTGLFERPFQPLVGGNVKRHLFENLNPITIKELEFSIKTTITNNEPRVSIISVNASGSRGDNNQIDVSIRYKILSIGVETTYVVKLNRIV